MFPSSPLRHLTPGLVRQARNTTRAAQCLYRVPSSSQCASALAPIATAPVRRWHSSSTNNTKTNPSTTTSSVNAEEISHFNELAATWWHPHGSSRALHLMNPLRHDFIRSCRASAPTPSASSSADASGRTDLDKLRYLDVGCGGGIFAESAARLPTTVSVTAIDPSPGVLAIARQHKKRDPALTHKLTYLPATIETLSPLLASQPQDQQKFDVVTLFEVIEHVDHPAAFLDQCGEFVKPGGWLILSTIARTWTSWFTTNFMAEDVLGIVPKGTHDWHKYINESEMRGHFTQQHRQDVWDLRSVRVMGVVYVPGVGWKEVRGSEKVGNYFFGVQRKV